MGVTITRLAGFQILAGQPAADDVSSLKFSERLILWTLRYWWREIEASGTHRPTLAKAYSLVNAKNCVLAIDKTLWVLRMRSARPIDILDPVSRRISLDEQRLLHALGCIQRGAPRAASPCLRNLLDTSVEKVFHRAAECWMVGLEAAQVSLPLRDWDLPELTVETTLH